MLALQRPLIPNKRPQLPDGIRIYALTDIHGCADLLQQMFDVIDADLARSGPVRAIHVFLGDYVDRGPDSRGTIDLLIERARQHECIFLKGNHELLLIQLLGDPDAFYDWKRFGGLQTLVSYGIRPPLNPSGKELATLVENFADAMPRHHREFLRNLRSSFSCGDFFFAHAGVRPGIPLDQQTDDDLLWIRDEFLNSDANFGKYVVHGHSPVTVPDVRSNRINIDTGAYATGNLTLLMIQGARLLPL